MWKCLNCDVVCEDEEESCWQCSTKKSVIPESESTGFAIQQLVKNSVDEKQIKITLVNKKCPFCSEEIQVDAVKCRYCGEFLIQKNSCQPVPKQKKYGHSAPVNHEEAVAWLVKEAQTSDILVALAKDLAHSDSFNRFEKFFVPKKLSQSERGIIHNLYCGIFGNEAQAAGEWNWIDVLKGAFMALGDKTNAKQVDDAIAAEFGKEHRKGSLGN